ncbi:hypothetical protein LOTGIDRAFT_124894 [Lottia gigantea]|uniref:RNA helicase n=1 Tax=Lottia gigantea TaxID=225164 RepID=V4A8K4_LOTGI|nr:hypothetical protein LOTGIDRAFT_124894 [Lottia gigantea]ESO89626.1 hypothetical protein LOTGIDRAFT_124894 [Lottia gigantea]
MRGPRPNQPICIGEEVKIGVQLSVERFRLDPDQKELEFPYSLTATERAYIHRLCENYNLKSKSHGKKSNRCITIYKKGNSTSGQSFTFQLARNSQHQILNLLQRFPLTNKEIQELQPKTQKSLFNEVSRDMNFKTTTGRLNNGVPQVPCKRGNSDLNSFRESLPIQVYSRDIVSAINNNQIVLVSSETGSGKTTQVPQMILDDCYTNNKPCRILCTQPRRIAALTIAERVANERGEKIGQTVGYQIRLESKVSPKTLLTFCTNGVLLRTLMGGDSSLASVTHVIIDEVHERDRFSDFLLIVLRDGLVKFKNLRLILMSATINIDLFVNYFGHCPIASIPGNLFNVEEFFLEDVLKWTEYSNRLMKKFKSEQGKVKKQQEQLSEWCEQSVIETTTTSSAETQPSSDMVNTDTDNTDSAVQSTGSAVQSTVSAVHKLEENLKHEMDRLLSEIWLTGKEELFSQVFHLILSENVSVDYKHSETSVTSLMIACGRGFNEIVEKLLSLGASVNIKASNDWTAIDWCQKFNQIDIKDMLEAQLYMEKSNGEDKLLNSGQIILSAEDQELLSAYQHSFDDERVDVNLLFSLIYKIHTTQSDAILVFLPGYDDIVAIRDKIAEDKNFEQTRYGYVVYVLHSAIQSSDQKRVFRYTPSGVRKIILSTNIAETSITINDVVFVVDCGKVKEKTFDALSGLTMLKSNWISRASSQQRKGRAGRCQAGKCYHLFSRIRYSSMMEYQQPEILRYPLQELCLDTKLLAPVNTTIADFLSKAPDAPGLLVVKNSVNILKQIDALDPFEDLTELGHHLTDLPIEPRLGKMVLYSVVLKCLDPILTIVCSIAHKDPFVLPTQAHEKRASALSRRKFAADTYSDHMALLRAFQAWQKARTEGWERGFCEKNYLSSACMEMIVGMRTQLLGQLRASGFVRARGGGDIRDLNTNSENWAIVKAALCAGMYPNLVKVNRSKKCLMTQKHADVQFHMSSVLSAPPSASLSRKGRKELITTLPSDWLIFEEMTRFQKLACVRCCTLVSPMAVALFAGSAKLPDNAVQESEGFDEVESPHPHLTDDESSESEGEDKEDMKKSSFSIDEWISFRIDKDACQLVYELRQKWNNLFLRRMRAPAKPWSQMDESIIRAVINVLTNEEQSIGLQQPAGIGQRPRPMYLFTCIVATETMMSGSHRGGYHHDDYDSNYGNRRVSGKTPTNTPPRRNQNFKSPSSKSLEGSEGSSGTNSQRGSTNNTPCSSPQLATTPCTGKWIEPKDRSTEARYFIMKCRNQKLLDICINKGIWATNRYTSELLNILYKEVKNIYLIFSLTGSKNFHGYARMTSEVSKEKSKEFYSIGTGNFSIEWIKKGNINFQSIQGLNNAFNDGQRVQDSGDGQELDPKVAEALLKLWDQKPKSSRPKSASSSGEKSSENLSGSSSRSYSSVSPSYTSSHHSNTNNSNYYHHNNHQGHGRMNMYQQGGVNYSGYNMYGNPGGVMMPSANVSPRPGMSPVMILQRGSPQGQGHPNFSHHRGYSSGYHHGNHK